MCDTSLRIKYYVDLFFTKFERAPNLPPPPQPENYLPSSGKKSKNAQWKEEFMIQRKFVCFFYYQIWKSSNSVCHDGENIVERFPRFCQFENSEKTERPEDGETTDAVSQKFHEGEKNDDEIKNVPTILQKQFLSNIVIKK